MPVPSGTGLRARPETRLGASSDRSRPRSGGASSQRMVAAYLSQPAPIATQSSVVAPGS